MKLRNTYPERRCQAAERLEGRRLLSGAGTDDGNPAEVTGLPARMVTLQIVEVLEQHPAEEEDGEEEEISLDPSSLPAEVRAGLEAEYPGAEILEVELEEDGEAEYEIAVRHEQSFFEVSLDADGELLETSHTLSQGELPPEVIDWVEANFDEAVLLEIELVSEDGQTSYELQIASDDAPPVEVTLRLDQTVVEAAGPPPASPQISLDGSGQNAGVAAPASSSEPQLDAATSERASAASTEEQPAAGNDEAVAESPRNPEETSREIWRQLEAAASVPERPTPDLTAASAEEAGLPPVSALLLRAMGIDLRSIDGQLRQLLGDIEKLAVGSANTGSGGLELRLALILALIAGVQVIRSEVLARRSPPVLFMESDRASAWTRWSATTMRE